MEIKRNEDGSVVAVYGQANAEDALTYVLENGLHDANKTWEAVQLLLNGSTDSRINVVKSEDGKSVSAFEVPIDAQFALDMLLGTGSSIAISTRGMKTRKASTGGTGRKYTKKELSATGAKQKQKFDEVKKKLENGNPVSNDELKLLADAYSKQPHIEFVPSGRMSALVEKTLKQFAKDNKAGK